ncbi:MAG: ATP-binding cassette domain-containing protein [Acidobacteria bacterium]|nr:MAG: ATP-binding cassette domain-containing protein [Acidobacteriota bacterium]
MPIVLDALSKSFGKLPVVKEFSLEVKDGELFVLLGSSGSGKSTVLRLIAGLLRPDHGRILLQGRDVTHIPPQQRGVGFVFQNYSIFRHMTASGNIEFGLKIRGVKEAERVRRRNELLDLVDLAGLGNRLAHQLSGGQLQRVALARALAFEPAILLLDEPFGALDVKTRSQLRRSLREIVKRLQVMTILVTHDQEEAFELADRIGVIERGRLLEIGEPGELYSRPKSLFAATFVGSGTVLVGREREGHVQLGGLSLPIPPERFHDKGASVQVLFRPEEVWVSNTPPRSQSEILGRGSVVDQTFTGSHKRVRLRLSRLKRVRQIAPHLPFGEEGTVVEALLPPDLDLATEDVYVGLKSWHILGQPSRRVLFCYSGANAASLLPTVRLFRDRLGAGVRVLCVANSSEQGERVSSGIHEELRAHGLRDADLLLRYGKTVEQIINEQATQLYTMMIMARSDRPSPEPGRLGPEVSAILRQASAPVLVVKEDCMSLNRILIATAAGEPGKNDVRFGGWIARRLGAAVTLVYVARSGDETEPTVQSHLDRALTTLKSLEIQAESVISRASKPEEGILNQAREGRFDLIVIGSHGPETRSLFGLDDVTRRVVSAASQPVLVVPGE